jgi:CRISPR/Cas system CMR subunit Cmr4 (Cas7 group RAMP superfamily)
MSAPAADRFLRLTLLTPANLGGAEGEAALDRPTHKDAVSGLPCLPASAIKGVLAGRYGDAGDLLLANPAREDRFGSPDRPGQRGRPGPWVLGDGDLLAFPVLACDGSVAWVVPAAALGRFLRLAPLGATDLAAILALLGEVESAGESRAFASPHLPDLAAAPLLRALEGPTVRRAAPALLDLLAQWGGAALPAGAPRLVVATPLARRLWQAAAEHRVLTALTAAKTVRQGSLRAIELIPAGTVFLTWATAPAGTAADQPLLQLGAWEALGLGWTSITPVHPPSALVPSALPVPSTPPATSAAPSDAPSTPSAISAPPGRTLPDAAKILIDMHAAVRTLREGAPELVDTARSAIADFASRVLRAGIEAALAFELAKAHPAEPHPKATDRSHRWLLETLLNGAPAPPPASGESAALLLWLRGAPFQPGRLTGVRELILTRWLWLRRHSELGLLRDPPENRPATPEEDKRPAHA